MHTMLQKNLQELAKTPKRNNLEDFVFMRVQEKLEKMRKVMLSFYAGMIVSSSVFIFFSLQYLITDLAHSGTFNYFKLLISEDTQTLRLFSQELLYAIFESLPMMSLLLTLGLLFMLMLSINGIISSLQKHRIAYN